MRAFLLLLVFLAVLPTASARDRGGPCAIDADDIFKIAGGGARAVDDKFQQCLRSRTDNILRAMERRWAMDLRVRTERDQSGEYRYYEDTSGTAIYSVHAFTDKDGSFTYFRNGRGDDNTFASIREFEDKDGRFKYFRKNRGDDNTVYSTRRFNDKDGSFFYLRSTRGDDNTFFSVRQFDARDGKFIYYRKNRGDDNTFLSIREFIEDGNRYIYIRRSRGDSNTFLSLKNGVFRNEGKEPISAGEFLEAFVREFWEPLIEASVYRAEGLVEQLRQ